MLKISDKYYIDSDNLNYILLERKISQKGKNAGKEKYDPIGYYVTIEQLKQSLIEKVIKEDLNILSNIDRVIELKNMVNGVNNYGIMDKKSR